MRIGWYAAWLVAMVVGCTSKQQGEGAAPDAKASKKNAAREAAGLRRVRLGLNWYPEAEHGGYYAALVHGYYREAGLDVEIVKGGPGAPIIPQVAGGQMEFGISNADGLLLGRAQDAPVVAVMAPLQISPRCIMVHERSGIDDFSELRNMTIAMSNSQPFYHFLRKQVPLEGVTIVPYQGTVAQFLLDENFAQQAYVFSEPFVARQQGGDPKSLMLADLGFNPYTSMLFTNEATIHQEPELVGKMVQVSVRGWEQYLASPEKTNRYIHQVNREMSLEALAYGAETLEPLVRDPVASKRGLGTMSLARWRELARQLEEIELLEPGAVRVEQAFTTKFLEVRRTDGESLSQRTSASSVEPRQGAKTNATKTTNHKDHKGHKD